MLCLGLGAASESDIAVKYLKKCGYISKGNPETGETPHNSPGNPGGIPQQPRKADDTNTISESSDCTCPMVGINNQGREDADMI